MKLKFVIVSTVAFLFIMATGCVTSEQKYSGFLKDYSQLQPDPMDKKGAMYWQASGVSFRSYGKFMVDPVSLHFAPELSGETTKVDPYVANALTAHLHKSIVAELSKRYEIVEKGGPGVARIRPAITSIDVQRKGMKVYNFVPVGLVITGVGEATGARDSVAVLGMEGEITDSLTGKSIASVVQTHGLEVDVKKEEDYTEKHAYSTLEYWAKKLLLRISSAK